MWTRIFRCAALVLALGSSAPAGATVAVETPLGELARQSDFVVRGKVTRTESRMSEKGGRIVTLVTMEVTEPWKGAPGGTVEILVPGGEANGFAQIVHGMPSFEKGEEAVVFLRRQGEPAMRLEAARPKPPPMRVVGLAQGKLTVEKAEGREVAVRNLEGLELVKPDTREKVELPERQVLDVARLKADVEAATK